MTERDDDFLRFYQEHRVDDQLRFYLARRKLFDAAAGQLTALSAVLLALATAVGALGGTAVGPTELWSVLATVLPAASTALSAYGTLYAFEQQSKIYGDAVRAALAARQHAGGDQAQVSATALADMVRCVEGVFEQEQARWGQLTSRIQISTRAARSR